VLLDEINLASSETLECIVSILRGPTASITLTELGSLEPVPRHPDFRLFACMNPATDVGKKDLPPHIRARFTEIDVPPPDADRDTLLAIVSQYIGHVAIADKAAIMDVAEFYAGMKKLSEDRKLADGSNRRPHFSMRTLARALTFASDTSAVFGLRRALWEGVSMAFMMGLDEPSTESASGLAQRCLFSGKNIRAMLSRDPSPPAGRSLEDFVRLGPFFIERGPLPVETIEDYVLTPSVERKLIDLARIVLTRRFPVLIEGPTSAGKTSAVEYLARRTGHRFVRINNHEHTDIQEYIGTYVSDPETGKLTYTDGLLVRALRNGDWIVLDELNLAPTDVLEALNRLLDDNRELVIPETGEVVTPHPHFMLFATQNPPGLYAGRKVLSRAFRNRFLEVHFSDVPQAELETILCQRARIAPSYATKIVAVFAELQKRRQSARVFDSKQSFATLRDLFRWAGRAAIGYQQLAEDGYMLLAERARRDDDKAVVKEVIESIMKVRIDENALYSFDRPEGLLSYIDARTPTTSSLVWTSAMRRLYILLARALRFNEPVLLVGETGCGKTSVCQVFAEGQNRTLHTINCHQNSETADFIGGLRPVRNKGGTTAQVLGEVQVVLANRGVAVKEGDADAMLNAVTQLMASSLAEDDASDLHSAQARLRRLNTIFEWHDGPLVHAMRGGEVFLMDEISLADDSVLERLNSVLEPSRTLVLAERGGGDLSDQVVVAHSQFKLIATMNPGGDYGKKELSPALRNRFTEIWVPPVTDRADLEQIVNSLWKHEQLQTYTGRLLDFVQWLAAEVKDTSICGPRDLLVSCVCSDPVLLLTLL
jgi:midasin